MIRLSVFALISLFSFQVAAQVSSCGTSAAFTLFSPGASDIKSAYVSLDWGFSAIDAHYDILYRKTGTSTFLEGPTVSTTSGTLSGLIPGAQYQIKILSRYTCWDGAEFRDRDEESNTITITMDPLGVPSGLTNSGINQTSFTAEWNEVEGATSYLVEVFDGATKIYGTTVSDNEKFISDFDIDPGNTYSWHVKSRGAGSTQSAFSGGKNVLMVPAKPSGLSASQHGTTSFKASWNNVTGETGYRLDVSTSNTFATGAFVTGFHDLSVTGISKVVTGLDEGTTYYFRVRSRNGSGTSSNSNTATTITLPVAPLTKDAGDITQTSFTAKWDPATGAANYRLDVSADNFATFLGAYSNKEVTGTSHVIEALTPGTAYKYRLRAINASGTSVNSNETEVVTVPANPLIAAPSDIGETSFIAHWEAAQNATSYRLDVSSDDFNTLLPGFDDRVVIETSEEVTGLTAGTVYQYRVRAFNGGVSGDSDSKTIITLPLAPNALDAVAITQTAFIAGWEAVQGASAYRLDVSEDNFATVLAGYTNLEVDGTTQNVTGLTVGQSYQYRVRAVNASGPSANSDTIDVSLVPGNPVTTAATEITQASFVANWNALPDAISYRIDISTDNFATFLPGFNNREVLSTSVSVTGLTPGTAFQYRVRSINASGTSGNSNVTHVLLKPSNPIAHEIVKQNNEQVSQQFFKATWDPVVSATTYHIDVSVTGDFSSFISGYDNKTVDGAVNELKIEGLAAGTVYFLRLRAANASGMSENSNTVEVITVPAVPVLHKPSSITQNSFTVSWDDMEGADGYFLDVATTNTFANFVSGFQNTRIDAATVADVTGLSAGAKYFIRIRSTNISGTSSYSPVTEQITVPAAMLPQAITEREKTTNQVIITWNNVTGASFYEVQVAANELFTDVLEDYNPRRVDALAELVIDDLQPESAYFVRIKSGNPAGISEYSGFKAITTLSEDDGNEGEENSPLQIDAPVFNTVFTTDDVIQVNVSGGVGVRTVVLHYRPVMSKEFQEATINSATDQYTISIDSQWLDDLGLEFYFSVTDESGKTLATPTRYIQPAVVNATLPLPAFGGTLADYRIIALPYEVEEDAIERIVEPVLGAYDKGKWRLVRYQDGRNVDYSQGLSKSKMERGNGYWFNTLNEVTLPLLTASVPQNNQDTPFQLSLQAGWNQIGNPYPFPIDWQAVAGHNGNPETLGTLMVYDPENISLTEAATLNAFEGGFIFSDEPLIINIPVIVKSELPGGKAGKDPSRANRHPAEGWFVPITLSQGEMVNDLSGFGMHTEAKSGKDKFDAPVVPRFIRFLEWKTRNEDTGLEFARDVVEMKEKYTWKFTVDHNSSEPVSLRWNTDELANGSLVLQDMKSNVIIDMKQLNEYTFHGSARSFNVFFSRDPLGLATGETELGMAYPNPAREHVIIPFAFHGEDSELTGRLTVRTLSGSRVVSITAKPQQKGVQNIFWDLRDKDGHPVSAGLYFYELVAEQGGRTSRFTGKIIVN